MREGSYKERLLKAGEEMNSHKIKPLFVFMTDTYKTVKHLPTMRETRIQSLGWEDLLEKEMATHSSILAWRIP